jgi:acetyl esterase/lipase
MRVRPRIVLTSLLAIGLLGYAGAVALLYFKQSEFLYPRQTARTQPAAVNFQAAEEFVLDTADGEKVIVWHVPPKDDRPVVLFFHGNGDVLSGRVPRFRAIVANGTGLIALSYRGYGGSSGLPSEKGLLFDAAAAYRFAVGRYAPKRIVVWGFSLGTGAAVAIAAEQPIGKLVL